MNDCLRLDVRRLGSMWVHHPWRWQHPAHGIVGGRITREPTCVHVHWGDYSETFYTQDVINPPGTNLRQAFECGACGRIARYLYLPPGSTQWGCRICLKLSYATENESALNRMFTRKHALEAQLAKCGPRTSKRKLRLHLRWLDNEERLIAAMRAVIGLPNFNNMDRMIMNELIGNEANG